MHLELAPLEQGYKLVIQNTPKGQAAMIAPTHGLTPAGPRVQQGGNNDYWKYNEQGYSVRVHKRDRKAMFTPDHGKQSTCAAPLDRFDNYRRTIIHREHQQPLVLEDQYKTLTKEQRNREPTGGLWQGETWFRILPEQKEGTTRIQQEQSQNKQSTSTPVLTRHTGKQSEKETTIPPPEKVQRTTDYWIRDRRHWKRVHVIPRTEFYVPTPEDNGTDINKLLPTRYTNIHSENNIRRIEDNWTTEPQPTRKEQCTGSTTFEESMEYSEDLLTEDDTPQMATRYEQRQRQCLHNQHHRKYRNTTSHACHTEVGVQYMYKQKAGKQTIQSRHHGSKSYKLISPTSQVSVTSSQHRYLQRSTYKQAWQWQQ
jgi:hypothetical protein